MINRANYRDVKAYLDYLQRVLQNDEKTIKKRWSQCRHLLEWADSVPFPRAKGIDLTFPAYMSTARADGKAGQLSATSIAATCNSARQFFEWVKVEDPGRYKTVSPSWINTLRPGRGRGRPAEVKVHEFYSLEDVLQIARWEPTTLVERRNRAAMVFLYLSGMRADAFVSMPIACFDPGQRTVRQEPARGVRTKNHKAAITTLLNIPELLQIVSEWDGLVRARLNRAAVWYAHIDRAGETLTGAVEAGEGRRIILSRGIKRVCECAGVRYLSPHKLRHGHVVYALKLVKDVAGLKAVSQNVMHSNVGITDGIYGQFTSDQVHDLISNLSGPEQDRSSPGGLAQLAELLKTLQDNPGILETIKKLPVS